LRMTPQSFRYDVLKRLQSASQESDEVDDDIDDTDEIIENDILKDATIQHLKHEWKELSKEIVDFPDIELPDTGGFDDFWKTADLEPDSEDTFDLSY